MATSPPEPQTDIAVVVPKPSGITAALRRFLTFRGAADIPPDRRPLEQNFRQQGDNFGDWDYEPSSIQALMGAGVHGARNRFTIYQKYQQMLADPIVSSAIRLHVTGALGGHEAKGEMVFIEPTAAAKNNPQLEALVKEISDDLKALLNRIAPTVGFNACGFGDGYGRIYADDRVGVRDVNVDEMMYPPLVQPYERGTTTIGYTVSTGARAPERLTVLQVARMKMPRMIWTPQPRVIDKAMRVALRTDRLEELPAVPAMVGGSFLDGAEIAYDKFSAAWAGLVGQRVQASINETLITIQQQGMTKEQSKAQKSALTKRLDRLNAYVQQVVDRGMAVFTRIFHVVPVNGEKQLERVESTGNAGVAAPFTVEDIMMHARFLANALGHDLSMLGFADQMAGGLGEGGWFRLSAQAAERARAMRTAMTEFFDHIISVHLLTKKGISFDGMAKPWEVTYYSGISALETERQKTKADAMNSTALLVQIMDSLKNIGMPKKAVQHLMEREMGLDAEDAKAYAEGLDKAKPPEGEGGFGGGGLGGFASGGGDEGGEGGGGPPKINPSEG